MCCQQPTPWLPQPPVRRVAVVHPACKPDGMEAGREKGREDGPYRVEKKNEDRILPQLGKLGAGLHGIGPLGERVLMSILLFLTGPLVWLVSPRIPAGYPLKSRQSLLSTTSTRPHRPPHCTGQPWPGKPWRGHPSHCALSPPLSQPGQPWEIIKPPELLILSPSPFPLLILILSSWSSSLQDQTTILFGNDPLFFPSFLPSPSLARAPSPGLLRRRQTTDRASRFPSPADTNALSPPTVRHNRGPSDISRRTLNLESTSAHL
ncbi:hypothetical protein GGR56DRAFT_276254 [Xylariaceae sp. FL0804]|nr:hypothetical protein GGR56DRAFT_276254 [Xylariaceae sp. FL0804]